MGVVALLLTAAAMALTGLALARFFLRARLRVLLALSIVQSGDGEGGGPAAAPRRRHAGSSLRAAVKRAATALALGPLQRWAESTLQGTGLPLRPEELLLLCTVGPVAGYALAALFQAPGFLRLLFILAGSLLPPVLCRQARTARSRRISVQLGDVLMTLGNALRAGHSLLQALDTAASQSEAPLGPELRRLLREIAAGIPVDEAFERLVGRSANADLELLVTAIRVQREVGGNLAEVLDKISGTIRARVAVKNHLRVVTAQSRLSGIVVAVLPVAVFALTTLIAPRVEHTLTRDPAGRAIGLAAIVLEGLGILAIRRIVAIRY